MANSESINSSMMETVIIQKPVRYLYDNGLRHERVDETYMIDNEIICETMENIIIRGGSRAASTSKMECFVIIVNGR